MRVENRKSIKSSFKIKANALEQIHLSHSAFPNMQCQTLTLWFERKRKGDVRLNPQTQQQTMSENTALFCLW